MMRSLLFPKFRKTLSEEGLVRSHDTLVIAVSGGIDSMTLLHLFSRLAPSWDLRLVVAHVNHELRGRASNADERLVVEMATLYGFECRVKHARLSDKANLQENARTLRRDFFLKVARDVGAHAIATAHHQGDQAETVLLHLIRGSGLKGLAGMSFCDEAFGCRVIRPLLHVPREQIERYATEQQVVYRNDQTNRTSIYRRNFIRHRIVPALREVNPRIVESLTGLAKRLAADEQTLEQLAEACLHDVILSANGNRCVFSRGSYLLLPQSLRARLLRRAFEQLTSGKRHLNASQLEKMDAIAGRTQGGDGFYRLPAPWTFLRHRDQIMIAKERNPLSFVRKRR